MPCMYGCWRRPDEGVGATEAGVASGMSCPVWVLGPELGSSGKAGTVLKC